MLHTRTKGSKGFTLVELILTVAILGILVVAALPTFQDLSTEARQGSRDGVIACVRSGLKVYYANQLASTGTGSYPATLDSAGNAVASSANPVFGNICDPAVSDGNWTRNSDVSYDFDDGTTTFSYTYSPAAGTFSE